MQVFGQSGVIVLIIWLALLNISMHFVWVSIGELLAKVSNSPVYDKCLNLFYAACLIFVSCWLIYENPMINTVIII